jgi:hypothetical protein
MASAAAPRHSGIRTLLAVLVLLMRASAPGMALPVTGGADAASLAALLGGDAICHAGGDQDSDRSPAAPVPGHTPGHAHDCGLCPACHLLGAPALPAGGVAVIPPLAVWTTQRLAALPPATGPPQARRTAARPRGPPSLSV